MLHPALTHVRGLLLDLDGTLYTGGEPVPGAVETVRALERAGVPFRFVTNTTSKSRAAVAEKLAAMGFPATELAIFSPPYAAGALLRERGARAHLLVPDAARPDFDGVSTDDTAPDVVVLGDLGTGWTFEALNRAFRLVHGGAALLALGRTRYWQTEEGLQLDVGPFVAALEYATGRDALVIGKPAPRFFLDAVAEIGLEPGEVALVGDDAETDVRAAQRAGLVGVLVRTGKFRPADTEGKQPSTSCSIPPPTSMRDREGSWNNSRLHATLQRCRALPAVRLLPSHLLEFSWPKTAAAASPP